MIKGLIPLILVTCLSACSFGGDEQELRAWMDEAGKNTKRSKLVN